MNSAHHITEWTTRLSKIGKIRLGNKTDVLISTLLESDAVERCFQV